MIKNCIIGTYAPDPTDTSGINSDKIGITWVTFDSTSGFIGQPTPRIFVGVADVGTDNIFVSDDAGSTCQCPGVQLHPGICNYTDCYEISGSAIAGFNNSWIPHKGVLSPAEKSLYVSTSDGAGGHDRSA